jgi:ribitol-5-phosphate 2-dehydrogenase
MIQPDCREFELQPREALLRPLYLSICRADQRYYQGNRPPEVLAKKLPMALIHECCATVVYDPTGTFKKGDTVVPCPNVPSEVDAFIAENYLPSSKFRSSGYDGFMQEYVAVQPERLTKAPANIPPQVLAFLELISVSMHALTRFDAIAHGRREKLAVWGDGNLGFIHSLLLRYLYPQAEITVLGVDEEKLSYFTFCDRRMHVNDLPKDKSRFCDHAFECVGGQAAQYAINQMIDVISPEATISLLGVSENPPPVNTRLVLEKGLRLFGSSRSGVADFQAAADLLAQNPKAAAYLEQLVGEVIPVRSLPDIHKAFAADNHLRFGKTVMSWEI